MYKKLFLLKIMLMLSVTVVSCNEGPSSADCETDSTSAECTIDVDDCINNACENDSTCVDGDGAYTCTCAVGYTGDVCETNIDDCESNPCENGGVCVDGLDSYTCTCAAGYAGDVCETNIDDCESNPCENGGVCVDGLESYSCTCPAGYTGDVCETNIDDCSGVNPCQNGGTCVDEIYDYSCECPIGYSGKSCHVNDNTMVVSLRLVNLTSTPLTVVIFQRNVATGVSRNPFAWRVAQLDASGEALDELLFDFTHALTMAAESLEDSSLTPQITVSPSYVYDPYQATSGVRLVEDGSSSLAREFEYLNDPDLTSSVYIYRDELVIDQVTGLSSGDVEVFEYRPTFWIGCNLPEPNLAQGDQLTIDQFSAVNTEISILGIASSDIEITDNGFGGCSFSLANVLFPS